MLMLNTLLDLMHFVMHHFVVEKRMESQKMLVKVHNIGEHTLIAIYHLELFKI